jgi:hypothetical protein
LADSQTVCLYPSTIRFYTPFPTSGTLSLNHDQHPIRIFRNSNDSDCAKDFLSTPAASGDAHAAPPPAIEPIQTGLNRLLGIEGGKAQLKKFPLFNLDRFCLHYTAP